MTDEDATAAKRRDFRIAAFEMLGGALAVLRRRHCGWYDDDIRALVTQAVGQLSVAQSMIKERIAAQDSHEDLRTRSRH